MLLYTDNYGWPYSFCQDHEIFPIKVLTLLIVLKKSDFNLKENTAVLKNYNNNRIYVLLNQH